MELNQEIKNREEVISKLKNQAKFSESSDELSIILELIQDHKLILNWLKELEASRRLISHLLDDDVSLRCIICKHEITEECQENCKEKVKSNLLDNFDKQIQRERRAEYALEQIKRWKVKE